MRPRSAEIPPSPVAAGMVQTNLPTPGAMAYALAGNWAQLPLYRATGASTVTQNQPSALLGPFDLPIVLGVHVLAPPQAKIGGLGGSQTGDIAKLQPLYDTNLQTTGYVAAEPLRSYGYGI